MRGIGLSSKSKCKQIPTIPVCSTGPELNFVPHALDSRLGKRIIKKNPPWGQMTMKSQTHCRRLWQYGLWSFQTGGTKLERFLSENQRTQRKSLNFENWCNVEVSKSALI